MSLAGRRDQRRDVSAERAPDEPDDDAPGGGPPRRGGAALEPLGGGERVPGVLEQPGAGIGQRGAAWRADEQLQPQLVLERPHAPADLRLRAAQAQRRAPEVELLGHGRERP